LFIRREFNISVSQSVIIRNELSFERNLVVFNFIDSYLSFKRGIRANEVSSVLGKLDVFNVVEVGVELSDEGPFLLAQIV